MRGEEAASNNGSHSEVPMSGRSFGYTRVSTDDQNPALQLDALTEHGIPLSQISRDK